MNITINSRRIGAGFPAYIIAEMSANHHQDFDRAVRIIEAAREAGADAVKLQTYTPDTLTLDCDSDHFRISGTLWEGRTLHDLYSEAYTPWEWHPRLKEIANGLGLDCFSTPFDHSAVDFLEQLAMPAYKIASFENNDMPLLRRVAATGKPVIMSTGMAEFAEIAEAVDALRSAGCEQVALLKCTSAYPAPPGEANLLTIPHLADAFNVPVGLSDHTTGIAVPAAAAALGACIIEKHLTLSPRAQGPDSAFSLDPAEFREMVKAVRKAEAALGSVQYGAAEHERDSLVFRRSLFVVQDIATGERFTRDNIRSIRPGYGLAPRHYDRVIGLKASRDLARGTPLSWDHIHAPDDGN